MAELDPDVLSPFPASGPFMDLALKFRKGSVKPEHCSSIDPGTKSIFPLLQPSASALLGNPQVSVKG